MAIADFRNWFKEGINLSAEVGTTKKQITNTYQSTYSPTINRTYDFQYNIASGGSEVTTKKQATISQTPTITPSIAIIPSLSSKTSQPSSSGDRKSTRLNSSHIPLSRMPSSA